VTDSGVVEENAVLPDIFLGNAVPPNDIRKRRNGDPVAFHQIGLQRNAKSMVKGNSSFIKAKCLI